MRIDRQDLELSLLRTFLGVVQHRSMGRTAVALGKTQAGVSQRILLLEKIVGQKLFTRGRDGVALTGHGEVLVEHAHRALALNEETLARFRETSGSNPVRLGVCEEAALGQLTPALKRFRRAHPDVELKLSVAGVTKLESLMAQGELDFVVGDIARVAGQPVTEWNSRLAWFGVTDRLIDPCCPLPLVLSQNLSVWRKPILDSLRKAGREWRIVLEKTNLDSTIAAVESGLGVSPLLRDTVRHTSLRELKNIGLPDLPEITFGLFRGKTVDTETQSLLANAIAASLKPAKAEPLTDSDHTHGWLSNDANDTARIAI
jgi:DNA-binding transcriptional LysR family regulator